MDDGSVARRARAARPLALRGQQIKRSRRTYAEEVETARSEERYMTLLQAIADVTVAVESIDTRTEAIAALLGIPPATARVRGRMRPDRELVWTLGELVWTLAELGISGAPGLRREIIGRQDTATLYEWRVQAAKLVEEITDVLDAREGDENYPHNSM
jgi:hypothetical protein